MRILIMATRLGAPATRLTTSLSDTGHDVVVVAPDGGDDEPVQDLPPIVPVRDRLAWVLQLNSALETRAASLLRARPSDVIHAIGWDVAWASIGASVVFGIPLVATPGDDQPRRDLPGDHRRIAAEARAWLAREARATVPARATARTAVAAYERAVVQTARRRLRATTPPSEGAEHLA
ncbi:MAG: glycosyltransferase [Actinomycetota bacterium]